MFKKALSIAKYLSVLALVLVTLIVAIPTVPVMQVLLAMWDMWVQFNHDVLNHGMLGAIRVNLGDIAKSFKEGITGKLFD